MTCEEIRGLFSARADDALVGDERARLDAHLATCVDCGREWQRFEATVGLLRAVEPVRAPAGFVDRVLAARPQPWHRRVARGLFSPWPVKLPLEAAAVVLIAGLTLVVFQRSSDLQQAVRAPETPPPSVTQPAPTEGADRPPASERRAPARPVEQPSRDVATAPTGAMKHAAPSRAGQPPVADRRPDEAEPEEAKRTAEPPTAVAPREPSREAWAELRAKETPATTRAAPAPAAPSPAGQKTGRLERAMSRLEARAGAADVEASLAAPDRAAAEHEIRALVARLGGAVTSPGAASMEIDVPRAAWDELARELNRHGTLHVDRRPADLPPTVRLILRLE